MSEIKKTGGQYRKELYALIQGIIGRELTIPEHENVKKILVGYVKDQGEQVYRSSIYSNTGPVQHVYVCHKCGGKKEGEGKEFRKKHDKGSMGRGFQPKIVSEKISDVPKVEDLQKDFDELTAYLKEADPSDPFYKQKWDQRADISRKIAQSKK